MDEFVREWFHKADNDILNAKNNIEDAKEAYEFAKLVKSFIIKKVHDQ